MSNYFHGMLVLFRLLEESYVLKDPFSPDKDKFIVLGSSCTLCRKVVCVGTVGSSDLGSTDTFWS